jgi:hypothetical protein
MQHSTGGEITVPLNREEYEKWLKKYGDTESDHERDIEKRLTESFQSKGFANKREIIELLTWKFQMNKHRLKRQLNHIEEVPEEDIIEKTRSAFQSENEEEKIEILKSINGIGNATCSVVLTFHNPEEYCVFDIHAWRELFGKEPAHYHSDRALTEFFEKIRSISRETGMTCREVEKAIFAKNYLEGTDLVVW